MVRYRVHRANDVTHRMLERLKNFTNDPSRGDVRDDGTHAGSKLARLIDERLAGERFPRDTWIIIAWDLVTIVGWSMLTRVETSAVRSGFSVGDVGLYVHPQFRRQGFASGLIQESSEVARKHNMHTMVANPWNLSSHACFTRAGFTDPPVPGGKVCKRLVTWH